MRRLVVLLAVVLAGCNGLGMSTTDPSARPALGISNGTTLTVTLVVNGQPVGAFGPSAPQPNDRCRGVARSRGPSKRDPHRAGS